MERNFILEKAKELRTNQTEAEKILWQKLRNRNLGYKFVRQYVFDNKFILDFYCSEKKLVIELDGGQHNSPEILKTDKIRTEYLEEIGYTVLRFWNNDIDNNIEGVFEELEKFFS